MQISITDNSNEMNMVPDVTGRKSSKKPHLTVTQPDPKNATKLKFSRSFKANHNERNKSRNSSMINYPNGRNPIKPSTATTATHTIDTLEYHTSLPAAVKSYKIPKLNRPTILNPELQASTPTTSSDTSKLKNNRNVGSTRVGNSPPPCATVTKDTELNGGNSYSYLANNLVSHNGDSTSGQGHFRTPTRPRSYNTNRRDSSGQENINGVHSSKKHQGEENNSGKKRKADKGDGKGRSEQSSTSKKAKSGESKRRKSKSSTGKEIAKNINGKVESSIVTVNKVITNDSQTSEVEDSSELLNDVKPSIELIVYAEKCVNPGCDQQMNTEHDQNDISEKSPCHQITDDIVLEKMLNDEEELLEIPYEPNIPSVKAKLVEVEIKIPQHQPNTSRKDQKNRRSRTKTKKADKDYRPPKSVAVAKKSTVNSNLNESPSRPYKLRENAQLNGPGYFDESSISSIFSGSFHESSNLTPVSYVPSKVIGTMKHQTAESVGKGTRNDSKAKRPTKEARPSLKVSKSSLTKTSSDGLSKQPKSNYKVIRDCSDVIPQMFDHPTTSKRSRTTQKKSVNGGILKAPLAKKCSIPRLNASETEPLTPVTKNGIKRKSPSDKNKSSEKVVSAKKPPKHKEHIPPIDKNHSPKKVVAQKKSHKQVTFGVPLANFPPDVEECEPEKNEPTAPSTGISRKENQPIDIIDLTGDDDEDVCVDAESRESERINLQEIVEKHKEVNNTTEPTVSQVVTEKEKVNPNTKKGRGETDKSQPQPVTLLAGAEKDVEAEKGESSKAAGNNENFEDFQNHLNVIYSGKEADLLSAAVNYAGLYSPSLNIDYIEYEISTTPLEDCTNILPPPSSFEDDFDTDEIPLRKRAFKNSSLDKRIENAIKSPSSKQIHFPAEEPEIETGGESSSGQVTMEYVVATESVSDATSEDESDEDSGDLESSCGIRSSQDDNVLILEDSSLQLESLPGAEDEDETPWDGVDLSVLPEADSFFGQFIQIEEDVLNAEEEENGPSPLKEAAEGDDSAEFFKPVTDTDDINLRKNPVETISANEIQANDCNFEVNAELTDETLKVSKPKQGDGCIELAENATRINIILKDSLNPATATLKTTELDSEADTVKIAKSDPTLIDLSNDDSTSSMDDNVLKTDCSKSQNQRQVTGEVNPTDREEFHEKNIPVKSSDNTESALSGNDEMVLNCNARQSKTLDNDQILGDKLQVLENGQLDNSKGIKDATKQSRSTSRQLYNVETSCLNFTEVEANAIETVNKGCASGDDLKSQKSIPHKTTINIQHEMNKSIRKEIGQNLPSNEASFTEKNSIEIFEVDEDVQIELIEKALIVTITEVSNSDKVVNHRGDAVDKPEKIQETIEEMYFPNKKSNFIAMNSNLVDGNLEEGTNVEIMQTLKDKTVLKMDKVNTELSNFKNTISNTQDKIENTLPVIDNNFHKILHKSEERIPCIDDKGFPSKKENIENAIPNIEDEIPKTVSNLEGDGNVRKTLPKAAPITKAIPAVENNVHKTLPNTDKDIEEVVPVTKVLPNVEKDIQKDVPQTVPAKINPVLPNIEHNCKKPVPNIEKNSHPKDLPITIVLPKIGHAVKKTVQKADKGIQTVLPITELISTAAPNIENNAQKALPSIEKNIEKAHPNIKENTQTSVPHNDDKMQKSHPNTEDNIQNNDNIPNVLPSIEDNDAKSFSDVKDKPQKTQPDIDNNVSESLSMHATVKESHISETQPIIPNTIPVIQNIEDRMEENAKQIERIETDNDATIQNPEVNVNKHTAKDMEESSENLVAGILLMMRNKAVTIPSEIVPPPPVAANVEVESTPIQNNVGSKPTVETSNLNPTLQKVPNNSELSENSKKSTNANPLLSKQLDHEKQTIQNAKHPSTPKVTKTKNNVDIPVGSIIQNLLSQPTTERRSIPIEEISIAALLGPEVPSSRNKVPEKITLTYHPVEHSSTAKNDHQLNQGESLTHPVANRNRPGSTIAFANDDIEIRRNSSEEAINLQLRSGETINNPNSNTRLLVTGIEIPNHDIRRVPQARTSRRKSSTVRQIKPISPNAPDGYCGDGILSSAEELSRSGQGVPIATNSEQTPINSVRQMMPHGVNSLRRPIWQNLRYVNNDVSITSTQLPSVNAERYILRDLSEFVSPYQDNVESPVSDGSPVSTGLNKSGKSQQAKKAKAPKKAATRPKPYKTRGPAGPAARKKGKDGSVSNCNVSKKSCEVTIKTVTNSALSEFHSRVSQRTTKTSEIARELQKIPRGNERETATTNGTGRTIATPSELTEAEAEIRKRLNECLFCGKHTFPKFATICNRSKGLCRCWLCYRYWFANDLNYSCHNRNYHREMFETGKWECNLCGSSIDIRDMQHHIESHHLGISGDNLSERPARKINKRPNEHPLPGDGGPKRCKCGDGVSPKCDTTSQPQPPTTVQVQETFDPPLPPLTQGPIPIQVNIIPSQQINLSSSPNTSPSLPKVPPPPVTQKETPVIDIGDSSEDEENVHNKSTQESVPPIPSTSTSINSKSPKTPIVNPVTRPFSPISPALDDSDSLIPMDCSMPSARRSVIDFIPGEMYQALINPALAIRPQTKKPLEGSTQVTLAGSTNPSNSVPTSTNALPQLSQNHPNPIPNVPISASSSSYSQLFQSGGQMVVSGNETIQQRIENGLRPSESRMIQRLPAFNTLPDSRQCLRQIALNSTPSSKVGPSSNNANVNISNLNPIQNVPHRITLHQELLHTLAPFPIPTSHHQVPATSNRPEQTTPRNPVPQICTNGPTGSHRQEQNQTQMPPPMPPFPPAVSATSTATMEANNNNANVLNLNQNIHNVPHRNILAQKSLPFPAPVAIPGQANLFQPCQNTPTQQVPGTSQMFQGSLSGSVHSCTGRQLQRQVRPSQIIPFANNPVVTSTANNNNNNNNPNHNNISTSQEFCLNQLRPRCTCSKCKNVVDTQHPQATLSLTTPKTTSTDVAATLPNPNMTSIPCTNGTNPIPNGPSTNDPVHLHNQRQLININANHPQQDLMQIQVDGNTFPMLPSVPIRNFELPIRCQIVPLNGTNTENTNNADEAHLQQCRSTTRFINPREPFNHLIPHPLVLELFYLKVVSKVQCRNRSKQVRYSGSTSIVIQVKMQDLAVSSYHLHHYDHFIDELSLIIVRNWFADFSLDEKKAMSQSDHQSNFIFNIICLKQHNPDFNASNVFYVLKPDIYFKIFLFLNEDYQYQKILNLSDAYQKAKGQLLEEINKLRPFCNSMQLQ